MSALQRQPPCSGRAPHGLRPGISAAGGWAASQPGSRAPGIHATSSDNAAHGGRTSRGIGGEGEGAASYLLEVSVMRTHGAQPSHPLSRVGGVDRGLASGRTGERAGQKSKPAAGFCGPVWDAWARICRRSRAPPVQERVGIRTGPDVLYRALGPIYTDPGSRVKGREVG